MPVRELLRVTDVHELKEARGALQRGRVAATVRGIVWAQGQQPGVATVAVRLDELWPVEVATVVARRGGGVWRMLDDVDQGLLDAVHAYQAEHAEPHELLRGSAKRVEWTLEGFDPGCPAQGGGWDGGEYRTDEPATQADRNALLGKHKTRLVDDVRFRAEISAARASGAWGTLDVYSDGGADHAGTPYATAEYGWVVGGTHASAFERWSEGGAPMRGPPEDMDSNRAELYGAIAVLEETKEWEGTVKLWLDNENVGNGLRRLLGVVPMADVWSWDRAQASDGEGARRCRLATAGGGHGPVGVGRGGAVEEAWEGGGRMGAGARGWEEDPEGDAQGGARERASGCDMQHVQGDPDGG